MEFTGKSLKAIQRGIELALAEIHNQIATCPDVFNHAQDLEVLEEEQVYYEKLNLRVIKAIQHEQTKRA